MDFEKRLLELGIKIPPAPKPVAAFIPSNNTNNLVYTSGQDCRVNGKLIYEGKVGKELTIEEGYQAARQCAINCLVALKDQIGDLNKVNKIVKLLAFVASADGFVEQPFVINGASDLLEQVFQEKGKHARSAIGTSELPFNTPVEIEMIVEVSC